jgi:hypothetical protein
MVVTDGSTEIDLYLKLESIKTLPKPAKFTFAKKEIQYSTFNKAPFLVVEGSNDVVVLT